MLVEPNLVRPVDDAFRSELTDAVTPAPQAIFQQTNVDLPMELKEEVVSYVG